MKLIVKLPVVSIAFCLVMLQSCKKDETTVFSDNNIPNYSEIPTILVENYVNRLYIDLIGREPTDLEMSADVTALESGDLSTTARTTIVNKLMYDTNFIEGDTSYNHAYYSKFYSDTKSRILEGASEGAIWDEYYLYYYIALNDSLNGNMLGYEILLIEAGKVLSVLNSRNEFRLGLITVDEMYRRMIFNALYDQINMNTFNFINASFDNMFYRYPTEAEFNAVFPVIDYNGSGIIFGQVVSNKAEYLQVLTTSNEFKEGMIRWAYQLLMSREPTSSEIFNRMDEMDNGYNIQLVQQSILISDEYAGFN